VAIHVNKAKQNNTTWKEFLRYLVSFEALFSKSLKVGGVFIFFLQKKSFLYPPQSLGQMALTEGSSAGRIRRYL